MENRHTKSALPALPQSPTLADYAGALHLCCSYARDAAQHGRFSAAHGLFQSAIVFYDCAQQSLASQRALPSHDSLLADGISTQLLGARAELDDCALCVYPDDMDYFRRPSPIKEK